LSLARLTASLPVQGIGLLEEVEGIHLKGAFGQAFIPRVSGENMTHSWVLVGGAVILILLVGLLGGIYFLESRAGLEFFPGLNQKYCQAHTCIFIQVVGNSMNPSLQSNQRVLFVSDYYSTQSLAHGDIVQISSVIPLVKRIVAVEGDRLELRGNVLYRNNVQLLEPYLLEPVDPSHYSVMMEQLRATDGIMPPGKVVALGDNRNASTDSGSLGLFSKGDILGKIVPFGWMDAVYQNP
jgi:signal peptidase I